MTTHASPESAAQLTQPLARWYRANARQLPWRETRDPYGVWISEIMLQQTQVKTVVPYYERFLRRFPDAGTLAAADEDEVLEYWAGLGYYERGRNLRRTAQKLVTEYSGRLPSDLAKLRELPGIGEYTAAAIGSIAFDQNAAVVDGNVERVLARYLGYRGDPKRAQGKRLLEAAATHALCSRQPGDHNQAMMELGATVCTKLNPDCKSCPLRTACRAFAEGAVAEIPPVRRRRAPETQSWLALVRIWGRAFALERAPETAPFLRNQWGFPLVPWNPERGAAEEIASRAAQSHWDLETLPARLAAPVRHGITYRRLRVTPAVWEGKGARPALSGVRYFEPDEMDALPRLHQKIYLSVSPQA